MTSSQEQKQLDYWFEKASDSEFEEVLKEWRRESNQLYDEDDNPNYSQRYQMDLVFKNDNEYEKLNELFDYILSRYPRKNKANITRAFNSVVANLILSVRRDQVWVRYSRRHDHSGWRRLIQDIVDCLIEHENIINHVKGIDVPILNEKGQVTSFQGKSSCFRAYSEFKQWVIDEKLNIYDLAWSDETGVLKFNKSKGHEEDRKITDVNLSKNIKTKLTKTCINMNELYQAHRFEIAYENRRYQLISPFLYRVASNVRLDSNRFPKEVNNSRLKITNSNFHDKRFRFYEQGMRFYCKGIMPQHNFDTPSGTGYMHLRSSDGQRLSRSNIEIDGKKCLELDFKSFHPRLMYALCNIFHKESDLYFIEEFGECWNEVRSDIKDIFKYILFADDPNKANKSIGMLIGRLDKESPIRELTVNELVETIHKKHTVLLEHNFLYSGSFGACYLQYIDSLICEEVLNQFCYEKDYGPLLPIHDSFICINENQNEERLRQVMIDAYRKITGSNVDPVIDRKF